MDAAPEIGEIIAFAQFPQHTPVRVGLARFRLVDRRIFGGWRRARGVVRWCQLRCWRGRACCRRAGLGGMAAGEQGQAQQQRRQQAQAACAAVGEGREGG